MGAPVPSASHKARTIISYFILYISTLRRRETLTRRTPEEGRENKREIALWHVRLKRPQFFFKVNECREQSQERIYIYFFRNVITKQRKVKKDGGRERVIRKRISLLSHDNFFFLVKRLLIFFSRVPDSSTSLYEKKRRIQKTPHKRDTNEIFG